MRGEVFAINITPPRRKEHGTFALGERIKRLVVEPGERGGVVLELLVGHDRTTAKNRPKTKTRPAMIAILIACGVG